MIKISAVIITYNEEQNIQRCINSVKSIVDEIVVVDSYSTDNTKSICLKNSISFYENEFKGYCDQKNFATGLAKHDIVLSLDADEFLSDQLIQSIFQVKSNWRFDAYKMNRLNFFCGKYLKHTDWYPDKKIRLFDRRHFRWSGLNIHETVERIDNTAKVGFLKGDLIHNSNISLGQHYEKANKYADFLAREYYRYGKKNTIFDIIFKPKWQFIKSYFIKLGFLDGYQGYLLSKLLEYSVFQKYTRLKEFYQTKSE